jgi:phosphoribulokinase
MDEVFAPYAIYNHSTGDFDPPEYIEPKSFVILEGLLGYHSKAMRNNFDVKTYLEPEEELRVQWKIKRDTALLIDMLHAIRLSNA